MYCPRKTFDVFERQEKPSALSHSRIGGKSKLIVAAAYALWSR